MMVGRNQAAFALGFSDHTGQDFKHLAVTAKHLRCHWISLPRRPAESTAVPRLRISRFLSPLPTAGIRILWCLSGAPGWRHAPVRILHCATQWLALQQRCIGRYLTQAWASDLGSSTRHNCLSLRRPDTDAVCVTPMHMAQAMATLAVPRQGHRLYRVARRGLP
jgi:hypothetical protein